MQLMSLSVSPMGYREQENNLLQVINKELS